MITSDAQRRVRWVLGIALAQVTWMLAPAISNDLRHSTSANGSEAWIAWLIAPATLAFVAFVAAFALGTRVTWEHFAFAVATTVTTVFIGVIGMFVLSPIPF